MCGSINLVCPAHESIDKGIGNVAEHRADNLFKQFAGKFVMQLELNLAGIFSQGLEVPRTLKRRKGPSTSLICIKLGNSLSFSVVNEDLTAW